MTLEWEPITDNHAAQEMSRARVPGGWLVKAVSHIDGGYDQRYSSGGDIDSWVASITFVPDPTWEWGSEPLPLTESTPCENCGTTAELCLRYGKEEGDCCDKCLHGGKAE